MRKLVIVAAAALLLSGCTGAQAEPVKQAEPVEPVETVDPAITYCEIYTETMDEYLDFVTSVTSGDQATIDVPAWNTFNSELSQLDPSGLGKEWVDVHYNYVSMQSQINEILESGGGDVTFSTTAFKTGAIELPSFCVGAGYKATN